MSTPTMIPLKTAQTRVMPKPPDRFENPTGHMLPQHSDLPLGEADLMAGLARLLTSNLPAWEIWLEVLRHACPILSPASWILSIRGEYADQFPMARVRAEWRERPRPRVYTLSADQWEQISKWLEVGLASERRMRKAILYPIRCLGESWGLYRLERPVGNPFTGDETRLACRLWDFANLAAEKALLIDQNHLHSRLMNRLIPLAEAAGRSAQHDVAAQTVGAGAAALSGSDAVAVYGIDAGGSITQLWSQGLSSTALGRLVMGAVALGQSTGLRQYEVNTITDVATLASDSALRRLAEAEGIQTVAIFPIPGGAGSVTDIALFYRHLHRWTAREKHALEFYLRQAGLVLQTIQTQEDSEAEAIQTVLTLARAIDARDADTAIHSWRLADWAEGTARRMSCSQDVIRTIRWAALLHDIGKIGVPDRILKKPGPLTDEEWQVMKRHPELGAEILAPVKKMQAISPIVRWHQERYDGTGYPDGLAGNQIPLAARILTVVDAYGAMTDDRVYRKARTREEAKAELVRCAGKQFDAQVVDVFCQVLG